MAGYSGAPLARKLGIKAGARVALINAPPGAAGTLSRGGLPDGVQIGDHLRSAALDVIVLFVRSRAELTKRLTAAVGRLAPAGGLWIAWPKKASGVATDLSDSIVREAGLATGLVDNKVCAVDETWSGLRFVIRLQDRRRR